METVTENETASLTIQDFTPKGYGLAVWPREAPLPALKVEIAHTVRGDRIVAAMRKKMRGVRKGRLLEILQPAACRVPAVCAHAQVCGGCCWQQMSYAAQLAEKQKRVCDTFANDALVKPIIGAEKIFGYRNKMEFTFSENRGGMRYLGLMIAQAEPYVFNVEECHLASPWFTSVLHAVKKWWEDTAVCAYHPHRDVGALRYLTLREAVRTGQKMAILNVSGNPEYALTRSQLDLLVQAVQGAVGKEISLFLRIHQTKKGKPTQFFEMHLCGPDHIVEELHLSGGPLAFKISPISFFQPNTWQAEKLYDTALSMLQPFQPQRIFDLYCGTGTLSMAASRFAKEVVGIELSPEAVLDAKENAQRNQIRNCNFHQGDVGKVLTSLMKESSFVRPDAVIVDPPRAGLDALAIEHLKTLSPKVILYVSCNPLTQAENVQQLQAFGYDVKCLQPVDQFPHTYHIENIALLVRRS